MTRGDKGAIAVLQSNEVSECGIQEGLKVVDLTGAGDLFLQQVFFMVAATTYLQRKV